VYWLGALVVVASFVIVSHEVKESAGDGRGSEREHETRFADERGA